MLILILARQRDEPTYRHNGRANKEIGDGERENKDFGWSVHFVPDEVNDKQKVDHANPDYQLSRVLFFCIIGNCAN